MLCIGTTAATLSLQQSYYFRKRPHTRQIPNRCSCLGLTDLQVSNWNAVCRQFLILKLLYAFFLCCIMFVLLLLLACLSFKLWFVSFQ